MREPVRERLSIILNELGIGVAGRGEDLKRRHPPRRPGAQGDRRGPEDPRRRQNEALQRLARRLGHDPRAAGARAPARQRRDRELGRGRAGDRRAQRGRSQADIEQLPTFLRELTPDDGAARRAQRRDDAGARRPRRGGARHQPDDPRARPVLAGGASRRSSRSARRPTAARRRSRRRCPVITRPAPARGKAAKPVGAERRASCSSPSRSTRRHRARDGLRLLPGRPRSTASTRSATTCAPALIVNPCSTYAITPVFGCSANFGTAAATSARGGRRAPRDQVLECAPRARSREALAGTEEGQEADATATRGAPQARRRRRAPPARPAPTPTRAPQPSQSKTDTLLDYLFGGDG